MTRLFCDFPLAIGENIELPKDAARHIMVLRLSAGDTLTLFNGLGGEYQARITRIDRQRVTTEIVSHSSREAELPYRITLAQGIPEATKMDWIIEKSVELGVSDIIPLAAQRSVVRLNNDRAEKRLSRWQAIAISAAQQCGRNRLPHIASPVGTGEYLRQTTPSPRILFSPRATEALSEWARHQKPQNITLLIGPEGGFSPEEENMAEQQGVTFLSMGPRILRTETAGLAAVAAINALWETRPE
ncbi:16S rRNA (uracil(1498)-N(3))-methyltransferase [Oxalobacter sp. OxGP1]|uniref:16S rRNA (uracil(1498)-N(3))-methyltransferase n=1 Tax=Oxalobacter paeniformigenes TaxID=2946594 RepID=UPI0022AF491F|nr:16S rRNA (uracil(1498)-N(3))-methyltransferase [Oxalobacter paeniformigenes]MCZ4053850.1 16S rRNA (uracil(1498)-N(3))-methyltransferase [Oxalobacter paeniformigenes]